MSGIVEKVKDKVEAVLHKDKHDTHHTAGTHTAGTHTGAHSGAHSSGIANAADPRVDSGHHNTSALGGSHSTNAGPHDSNMANKLDPRVDSDRDGSRNAGAANYGPGGERTGQHTGITSGTGLASGTGYGSGSTNHGPHDSNLLNKADPRVDSDRDGSRNAGAAAYGPGSHQNTSGLGNTGFGSGSTNYGPHDSNLANKVDPRVDSDRDGSRNAGAAAYGPGAHNTGGTGFGSGSAGIGGTGSTNAGPHDSNLLNKLDPRVDSDRDGSHNAGVGNYGSGTHNTGAGFGTGAHQGIGHQAVGSGPAPGTAGPHSSNLANKLDPRVDSDRDGSNTLGNQQNY